MAFANGSKCPNCTSSDTRPGESGGRICRNCGQWF